MLIGEQLREMGQEKEDMIVSFWPDVIMLKEVEIR